MAQWIRKNINNIDGITPIKVFMSDVEEVSLFTDDLSLSHLRKSFDGIYTVILHGKHGDTALAYHDFKIAAGSYSYNNSQRFVKFLEQVNAKGIPLIYVINTMGVRIMEGRKVFEKAFRVIPALKSFAEKNLLITASTGKCLGLGALLYSLGDYTLALKKNADINLTGPEVIKMFFGETFDFSSIACAQVQQRETMLVHEVLTSKEEMAKRAISLSNNLSKGPHHKSRGKTLLTNDVLEQIFDNSSEVFSQFNCAVQTFIGHKDNQLFGILISPLNKPKMLDVKTIKKYRMSLQLFKKMKLPLFSIVDTIGADPRKEENDKGLIHQLTQLTAELIDYPYFKQGIISGRCYGGASVLAIPPFFGGEKTIAIKNSKVGIMSNGIIAKLLNSSSQLLKQWEVNRACECDQLNDMITSGVFSKVIYIHDLASIVKEKLSSQNIDAMNSDSIKELISSSFIGQPILSYNQKESHDKTTLSKGN